MTSEQIDLISKIRTLRIMFADAECDKIPSEAKDLVQSMTKELVETMHKTAIFYDENKDMWRTTIILEEGGTRKRKHISAKTESSLYNKLYDHYIGPGTLEDIHFFWVKQRQQENLAAATLQRERQRWEKYLAETELAKKRIDEIDNFQIEALLLRIIKEEQITAKELREIRFLLRKIFGYAFRHRLIPVNPMPDVEVNTTGCAPVQPRLSESRVYLSGEIAAIQNEITQELKDIPYNTTALAIRLLFVLGLRVGELVALRESDIDWERQTIHIQRMEKKAKKGSPLLVNHTKKKSPHGNRVLPLGNSGIAIIRKVMSVNTEYGFRDEDFLFLGEKGRRIHIRAVDNRIRKLCRRAGIEPAKSAHDIRRTVATRVYRSTHDIELVRKFLGHSDVQTTWGYIVDIDAEEEDRIRIVEALKDISDPVGAMADNTENTEGLSHKNNVIVFKTPPGKRQLFGADTLGREQQNNTLQKSSPTQVQHFFGV